LRFSGYPKSMTEALLLTMMDPAPGGEAEFNDWANSEHVPERKRIAGFRTALRFENKALSPRYLAIYDLDDITVLQRAAYLAISGEKLSPWSRRVLARASARWRFSGSRIGALSDAPTTTGAKEPIAELLLVLWRGAPEKCDGMIASTFKTAVDNSPGVAQSRVFVAESGGRFDYVGIAESKQPFCVSFSDPARYAAGSQTCDFAQVFVPLPVIAM
jgi:hypothetical protein